MKTLFDKVWEKHVIRGNSDLMKILFKNLFGKYNPK